MIVPDASPARPLEAQFSRDRHETSRRESGDYGKTASDPVAYSNLLRRVLVVTLFSRRTLARDA